MNSRLLHAAARGARVQVYSRGRWMQTNAVLINTIVAQRIHPDDAHLEYGPISRAIRDGAINDTVQEADLPYLMGSYNFDDAEYLAVRNADMTTFNVFKLILSEALADEGL